MAYIKPKSPLKENKGDNYFYPITTIDQLIVDGNSRLSEYSIVQNETYRNILLSSNWVLNNNKYIQQVSIDGLTEQYHIDVKPAYTGDLDVDLQIEDSAKCINYAKQDNNRITFYCLKNKPIVDIPIEMGVYV